MQQAKLIHAMVRVRELERSLQFYDRAFGLREVHRVEFPDFTLVYLRNDASEFELELTWNRGHEEPYVLGDGYGHLAVSVAAGSTSLRCSPRLPVLSVAAITKRSGRCRGWHRSPSGAANLTSSSGAMPRTFECVMQFTIGRASPSSTTARAAAAMLLCANAATPTAGLFAASLIDCSPSPAPYCPTSGLWSFGQRESRRNPGLGCPVVKLWC